MIKIRIYYLIIVIVSIIFLAIITVSNEYQNQNQDQVKKIISRGELRVSTINSPIISFNDKQEASGFDYELTKHFADYLGVKIRINVYLNINQLFNNLENGNSDFITAGLLYNEKRLDKAQAVVLPTIQFPSS
ncbi:MAG: transporter substrate-binding domain-containing protein [Arsenophonus sp. NC-WZS1-MAG3]